MSILKKLFCNINIDFDILKKIKEIPFFSTLTMNEIESLSRFLFEKKYNQNDIIIEQGQPADKMYILIKGAVKVNLVINENTKKELTHLVEPNVFGELALLDGGPRTAEIITFENSNIFILHRNDFMKFMKKYPVAANKILFNLGKETALKLRNTNEKLIDKTIINN